MVKQKYFDHLQNALKLNPYKDVISLVGGGGKTSTLVRLGNELSDNGKKVILTTTTRFEQLDFKMVRYFGDLTSQIIGQIETGMANQPVIVAKRQVRGNKIKGLSIKQIAKLNREINFDYMIIEADGAEKKSLKAHHKYEPPIPQCTTMFIVVIGFDIIGKRLNIANVHRPRVVSRVINKPLDSSIHPGDILSVLKHPDGLLKNRPAATRTVVILNKVKEHNMHEAEKLADDILKNVPGINSLICGELNKPHQLLLFS
ncbi:selenium cofactor biosynthesis protein YqeC [Elusimicrobiota bacterium]